MRSRKSGTVPARHYRAQIGSAWLPRTGSKVSHKALTAAVIDSRDFLSAKCRRENEVHCPDGTRIAFAGGPEAQDHNAIWAVLDQTREKYPDMILLHGANPTGAELIAAKMGGKSRRHPRTVQAGLEGAQQGRSVQTQR